MWLKSEVDEREREVSSHGTGINACIAGYFHGLLLHSHSHTCLNALVLRCESQRNVVKCEERDRKSVGQIKVYAKREERTL
jgi:hypothetical protein